MNKLKTLTILFFPPEKNTCCSRELTWKITNKPEKRSSWVAGRGCQSWHCSCCLLLLDTRWSHKLLKDLASIGLKHWNLLESKWFMEIPVSASCWWRASGAEVDFSLIGNTPASGMGLRAPVFQLSRMINCWWKSWDTINGCCCQCPRLDGRGAGTPLLAALARGHLFAGSQGAECLKDLL